MAKKNCIIIIINKIAAGHGNKPFMSSKQTTQKFLMSALHNVSWGNVEMRHCQYLLKSKHKQITIFES